jgi:hypothetical protein
MTYVEITWNLRFDNHCPFLKLFQVQLTGIYQDQQVTNLIRSRLTRGLGNTLVPAMSATASDFINMSLQDSQDRQYANNLDNSC